MNINISIDVHTDSCNFSTEGLSLNLSNQGKHLVKLTLENPTREVHVSSTQLRSAVLSLFSMEE